VITAGAVSSEPVAPSPKRDAILGFSVGIVLGIVLMLCIDYVDDRVRGPEDMERALPDEPLYGEIPNLEALATSPVLDLDDQRADTDTLAGVEAYRALATSLEFANIDDAPRILQVTSPIAGEGKSTTVANLASAFAATGIRVALVDADLRRPKMHEFFAVDNDAGLTTFVVGRTDLAESVSHPTGHPGLTVLTAGPATPDAAKVLHSEATEKLLDRLRQDHDLVILDTPPVLPLADALIVAQLTDLVVLVARAGSTGRRSLRSARAAIENVDGPPLAVVLNNAPRSGIGHDDYYGTYANSRDTSTATPEGEPSRRRFRGRAKSST
ncbi:MAG: polysaccharide biosynthesis tyrosine autokinase, partial [Actinomycetota bacterium]